MSARRPTVLFICADPVGERMAGLGIRYTELAGVLAAHADVTVAHGGTDSQPLASGVPTVPYRPHAPGALRPLIASADVVITHPQWPVVTSWLRRSRARVIFDLYDPETLETLELLADRPARRRRLAHRLTLDRLASALRAGHHFVCASEKQRDLWLGVLLGQGLISPALYDRDPTLRSVLDLVPFGVPDAPPDDGGRDALRERFEVIGAQDEVVLWNGGLWRWLDADTAIRAVARLAERRPGVRLVFMGASSGPAGAAAGARARALARDLGVLDAVVHFNDDWVPYARRASWLLHADCSLSTHRDHLETRFAFRTRLLDCFWAGLPVVCTGGDDLAEWVEHDSLGRVVGEGDDEAVAAALEEVLDRGRAAFAPALARAAQASRWSRAAQPLLRFLHADGPRPAQLADGARAGGAGRSARALAYRAGSAALAALRRRPPSL